MGGTGSGRTPNSHKVPLEVRQKRQAEKVTHLFAHPRLSTIPDSEFPLGKHGQRKYRELAEMLLKAGQLTTITRGFAESASVAFEQIYNLRVQGKEVRAALIQQYNRSLGSIQQLDVDKNLLGQTPQKENRFRHAGFASRLRKN